RGDGLHTGRRRGAAVPALQLLHVPYRALLERRLRPAEQRAESLPVAAVHGLRSGAGARHRRAASLAAPVQRSPGAIPALGRLAAGSALRPGALSAAAWLRSPARAG